MRTRSHEPFVSYAPPNGGLPRRYRTPPPPRIVPLFPRLPLQ
ncbi:hypothetical protein BSIN_3663 [Burkholderia singularis]|uniref:Uncharacterized protein n=1 Tax=Burkholderia singularis TaxID=1503053 RepID=A0A238H663_9BURK|nr:hypothetical protein BSIN_3663 [Burkholderia singularis]